MSPKTVTYVGLLFIALLVLALGGWLVKGAKALTGQTQESSLRPRLA
jgi:hypothetical protein